jgi:hypothetical protein
MPLVPPKRPAQSNAFPAPGNLSFAEGHMTSEQAPAAKPHIPAGTSPAVPCPFCGWCLR